MGSEGLFSYRWVKAEILHLIRSKHIKRVMTDLVFIMTAIDIMEGQDVTLIDLLEAFLISEMYGVVYMALFFLNQNQWSSFHNIYLSEICVNWNKGEILLYMVLKKVLYGYLRSTILFYLTNKLVKQKMPLTLHVDDIKISQKYTLEVDHIINWLSILGKKSEFPQELPMTT